MKIEDWGDRMTTRGQAVNRQPDGSSMIWIRALGLEQLHDICVQFGVHVTSAIHRTNDAFMVSEVPEIVIHTVGTFPVHILSSNEDPVYVGTFNVHPNRRQKQHLAISALNLLANLSETVSSGFAARLRGMAAERSPYAKAVMVRASSIKALPPVGWDRRILFVARSLPRPDASAAGRAIVAWLNELVALGYEVVFIATDMVDRRSYRTRLEDIGITVITRADGYSDVTQYVNSHGHTFGVFYLAGPHEVKNISIAARKTSPDAHILFHARNNYIVTHRSGAISNRAALLRRLESVGALPLDLYVQYCQQSVPLPLPDADPSGPVDVSIIIPVHNQWSLTRACLNSVAMGSLATGLSCEVVLADDNSTDGTKSAVIQFPGLRVVRQKVNLGFLRNCNAAAVQARGRKLLFLNNDTIVFPNWLVALFETMERNPEAAIVGSKFLFPDGTIQEAGGLLFNDGSAANAGRGQPQNAPLWNFDREVDYISGASILVDRSFWNDVGGFDERYVPGYCEDADLAMNARQRGHSVVYSARSIVVHFEHGSSAEFASTPEILMTINKGKLLEKWKEQLAKQHLSKTGESLSQVAYAERNPPHGAIARRQSGRLNILYVSTLPSVSNSPNIKTFLFNMRNLGPRVHFVFLQSTPLEDATLLDIYSIWDQITIIPYSVKPSSDLSVVPLDAWYDEKLGEEIRLLCQINDIDVIFCNCVFLSRIFECVSAHILKIIDSYDRIDSYQGLNLDNRLAIEQLFCKPEDVGAYLRRADIVVTRRLTAAQYFNELLGQQTARVLPYAEAARFRKKAKRSFKAIRIYASSNQISVAGVFDFIIEIAQRFGDDCPFVVQIVGPVRDLVSHLPLEKQREFRRPWIHMAEFVPDMSTDHYHFDLLISLVTMGPGINAEVLEAMSYGTPLLTTPSGIRGLETSHPLHDHETVGDLVISLLKLVRAPNELAQLSDVSVKRYKCFLADSEETFLDIFQHPKITKWGSSIATKPKSRKSSFAVVRRQINWDFARPD